MSSLSINNYSEVACFMRRVARGGGRGGGGGGRAANNW